MPIRTRLSVLLVAATLALAGCGMLDVDSGPKDDVSGMSGSELLEQAQRQVNTVRFISVKGSGMDGRDKVAVNLAFATNSASGSVEMNGVRMKVLNAGGNIYVKVSAKDLRSLIKGKGAAGQHERAVAVMGGRWVLANPKDKDFSDIAEVVTRKGVFDQLLDPNGDVRKGADKIIWGIDCVSLKDRTGTLYMDKRDGKPILLVADKPKGGRLSFSYRRVKEVKAPAKGDVVDLSKH